MSRLKAVVRSASALLCSVLISINVHAQTRGLSGTLTLDTGVALQNYTLRVTVNNHSFVVLPPVTFLRPIISSDSVDIILPAGSQSFNYELSNISTNAVDYSVQVTCLDCSLSLPDQLYSPEGNKFGFENAVYIDPENLPDLLDFEIITNASFMGTITLDQSAQRDLRFTASVVSNQNINRIYATGAPVTLTMESSEVAYRVDGVSRNIGQDQFRVQLLCDNCFRSSAQPQLFPEVLSAQENHVGIDFSVTDDEPITIAPMIKLLLDQ